MTWVRAENAKTLAVLENDPRFAGLNAEALKIAGGQGSACDSRLRAERGL